MSGSSEDSDISESEEVISKCPKKSTAFNSYEKSILFDLVKLHKDTIESKKTDFGAIHKKRGAWTQIHQQFIASPNVTKRTKDQLKKYWANSKTVAKKDVAKRKKKLKKTGGGPAVEELKYDTIEIMNIIPNQMVPLENLYDCDNETVEDIPESPANDATSPSNASDGSQQALAKDKTTEGKGSNQNRREYKDARSSLVDMEYEEHLLRMRILSIKMGNAVLKRSLLQSAVKFQKEEHDAKMIKMDLIVFQDPL